MPDLTKPMESLSIENKSSLRSITTKKKLTRGAIGLANLGNTVSGFIFSDHFSVT